MEARPRIRVMKQTLKNNKIAAVYERTPLFGEPRVFEQLSLVLNAIRVVHCFLHRWKALSLVVKQFEDITSISKTFLDTRYENTTIQLTVSDSTVWRKHCQ